MTGEERLDAFLDAFWDNLPREGAPADLDLWEEDTAGDGTDDAADAERFWDAQEVLAVPRGGGKLPLRTKASIVLILVLIPLTIWVGVRFFDDRKYLVIGLAIAVYSVIPFFLVFEGRKPQTKELLTIAVLVAIAVGGRAAFFMLPSFKPMAAVAIISAVCFGAESGFLVGALSMLASNMLFGQGPWTPWQMFAMGIIGFLAGILFGKGWLKARRGSLCIYGFLATLFIYGGIMNPASLVMYSYAITKMNLLAIYMSGLPMDLVHAGSTVLFLYFASRPMIEKLERIKIKYGMIEERL